MATVAVAMEQVSLADLHGLKLAAQNMGTAAFELAAGGSFANWVAILNALIVVKGGVAGGTAASTALVAPATAMRQYAPLTTLNRFHRAVTDADATEFDALAGDTRANVLLWLNDARSILIRNDDQPSSYAGWDQ
jgi:hypothetical protein